MISPNIFVRKGVYEHKIGNFNISPYPSLAPTTIEPFGNYGNGKSTTSDRLGLIIFGACLFLIFLFISYLCYRKRFSSQAYILHGDPSEFPEAEITVDKKSETGTDTTYIAEVSYSVSSLEDGLVIEP